MASKSHRPQWDRWLKLYDKVNSRSPLELLLRRLEGDDLKNFVGKIINALHRASKKKSSCTDDNDARALTFKSGTEKKRWSELYKHVGAKEHLEAIPDEERKGDAQKPVHNLTSAFQKMVNEMMLSVMKGTWELLQNAYPTEDGVKADIDLLVLGKYLGALQHESWQPTAAQVRENYGLASALSDSGLAFLLQFYAASLGESLDSRCLESRETMLTAYEPLIQPYVQKINPWLARNGFRIEAGSEYQFGSGAGGNRPATDTAEEKAGGSRKPSIASRHHDDSKSLTTPVPESPLKGSVTKATTTDSNNSDPPDQWKETRDFVELLKKSLAEHGVRHDQQNTPPPDCSTLGQNVAVSSTGGPAGPRPLEGDASKSQALLSGENISCLIGDQFTDDDLANRKWAPSQHDINRLGGVVSNLDEDALIEVVQFAVTCAVEKTDILKALQPLLPTFLQYMHYVARRALLPHGFEALCNAGVPLRELEDILSLQDTGILRTAMEERFHVRNILDACSLPNRDDVENYSSWFSNLNSGQKEKELRISMRLCNKPDKPDSRFRRNPELLIAPTLEQYHIHAHKALLEIMESRPQSKAEAVRGEDGCSPKTRKTASRSVGAANGKEELIEMSNAEMDEEVTEQTTAVDDELQRGPRPSTRTGAKDPINTIGSVDAGMIEAGSPTKAVDKVDNDKVDPNRKLTPAEINYFKEQTGISRCHARDIIKVLRTLEASETNYDGWPRARLFDAWKSRKELVV
ncbi:hypothetical protein MAA_11767 [Metarhizium robertsii ARSEF 23]|uniref:Uncharacterized protein n=1 Tax=Metarhizium robertsii (strain ARSEF 23 / ATCC MYA-3075) TaxID=655844 RepID=A0A0B2XF51_METRA|nr:uncharacterized protein MAA_11767 [Metarhizium robertsii ARSEF 23]KHO10634.1 hypothetical protein MAA_11767 [Metarhizium robertsii ARSEF 23]